jgi:hypothetical protein
MVVNFVLYILKGISKTMELRDIRQDLTIHRKMEFLKGLIGC